MGQQLYQHFGEEEAPFVAKLLDLVSRLEQHYAPQLTEFLDPRQVLIARSVLGKAGVTYYIGDASGQLEYARVLLAPDYYVLDERDFEMSLIEIAYQGKFSQLSHAQILGSLLNGLGLKRQVIGDILVGQGYAQVVVDQRFVPLILTNTDKMARTGVRLKELDWSALMTAQDSVMSELVLLSSRRLDKLVAAACRLSRQQAQALIASNRVKLNYQLVTKTDMKVDLGDLVSVRGFGRVRVTDDHGLTRNQKHKLTIEKTVKR